MRTGCLVSPEAIAGLRSDGGAACLPPERRPRREGPIRLDAGDLAVPTGPLRDVGLQTPDFIHGRPNEGVSLGNDRRATIDVHATASERRGSLQQESAGRYTS